MIPKVSWACQWEAACLAGDLGHLRKDQELSTATLKLCQPIPDLQGILLPVKVKQEHLNLVVIQEYMKEIYTKELNKLLNLQDLCSNKA